MIKRLLTRSSWLGPEINEPHTSGDCCNYMFCSVSQSSELDDLDDFFTRFAKIYLSKILNVKRKRWLSSRHMLTKSDAD